MIGYTGLAGLPPQAGLYTLLVAPVAYAVFGMSRHVVCAGTSAAAVLVASTVAGVGTASAGQYAGRGEDDPPLRRAVVGRGFAAPRLRRAVLSRPVVEGFVFALAIFVTVKQLPRLFPKPPLASGSHLVAR
jgi:MFS superfamily sulfate permease-like transporter